MKILIVITSNAETGTPQRTGLWLEEFTTPYYLFRDAQVQITLASPAGGTPPVDPLSEALDPEPNSNRRFCHDPEARRQFMDTVQLSAIDPWEFDAVYYPGGHGLVWDLVEDEHSRALLESFLNSGRPAAWFATHLRLCVASAGTMDCLSLRGSAFRALPIPKSANPDFNTPCRSCSRRN